jgi:hypothetical protein
MEDECHRQCDIGALQRLTPEEFEEQEWACPAFGIPKKNRTIRLIVDFRQVNANLIRRKYPLLTTEEILTLIGGFLFATSLDLNSMGYPSIPLDKAAKKILTVIVPFGSYECLTLPMGVMPASDIFQARMVHLFAGMGKKKPCPYINDILHFRGATFDEHLAILDDILKLIATAGMQVSAEKSRFCQELLKYLSFQLNRTGYKPLPSRVDAIMRLEPPNNVRQVRAFLGTINFIKNHILALPRKTLSLSGRKSNNKPSNE